MNVAAAASVAADRLGIAQRRPFRGGFMYEKPRVERFGTLRDLTKQDWQAFMVDGVFICGDASINTPGQHNDRS
jgi:hypothetical protein